MNESRLNNKVRRRGRRAARRAFTLLEIIVVVTIIAMLAALVAPRVIDNIWRSKQRIAKADVKSIAQQVNIYLLDNGMTKPPQDMDLAVLTTGPNPYLKPNQLNDPWGNPYMMMVPGEADPFDIVSYGGDGQQGGEGEDADVNSNKV